MKSFSAFVLIVFFCAPIARAANSGSVSGQLTGAQDKPAPAAKVQVTATSSAKTIKGTPLLVAAQEKTPVATSDKAYSPQLSGTVVDTSGAVIAGATVQVRSANGTVQRTTQSDTNGSFIISGLAAGNYRLVVSNPGFETKEILVTIGTTGAPAPLRISLAVGAVSTTINVQGREDDLIGIAESATQGTVGAKEIQDRPILRSGEILETVPGLIITQHAGGGKANQYFLRGFNLDHGTDIAIFLDDMPLNLPSHAHGEGYSDMNTVIPEFVKRVNFEKGPYYANVGNFSSAANAHVEFFKTLPENFFKLEGGTHTYGRAVFGASQKLGSGNLLYGGEEYYYNGPWVHPDAYNKINGFLTYSQGDDTNGASITAHAYHGKWNSSDQIPDAAQPLVGFFGTLNPSDGGHPSVIACRVSGITKAKIPSRRSWPPCFITISIYFPISLTTWWTTTKRTSSTSRIGAGWVTGRTPHGFQHMVRPQDVKYVRRAVPQRLDQQRPLPVGKSHAHDQD